VRAGAAHRAGPRGRPAAVAVRPAARAAAGAPPPARPAASAVCGRRTGRRLARPPRRRRAPRPASRRRRSRTRTSPGPSPSPSLRTGVHRDRQAACPAQAAASRRSLWRHAAAHSRQSKLPLLQATVVVRPPLGTARTGLAKPHQSGCCPHFLPCVPSSASARTPGQASSCTQRAARRR